MAISAIAYLKQWDMSGNLPAAAAGRALGNPPARPRKTDSVAQWLVYIIDFLIMFRWERFALNPTSLLTGEDSIMEKKELPKCFSRLLGARKNDHHDPRQ